jgi:DNA-binding response OmpR family regulator
VADDLIWGSRIVDAVSRAGGSAQALSSDAALGVVLEAEQESDAPLVGGAVVDLGSRRLDGIEAVRRVAAARLPVIAVARHDDQLTRRRALDAGAMRVFSYDKFFRDGPALVTAWLTDR